MTTQQAKTTLDVANRLVSLCREGKIIEASEELHSDDVISEEPNSPQPQARRVQGKATVREKGNQFASMIEAMHGGSMSDPVVGGEFFSIAWTMDVTMKGMGRMEMSEVCNYRVKDGKIVWEQFLYSM
jgi:ketosteroid isomerase-like protein